MTRPDEEAWLEWRKGGITATDVADAAAGTYGGAYGVMARKLGLEVVEQTPQMARGHRWQPVIADGVHVFTGMYVVGEETWCEQSPGSMVRATVDGFLADTPAASADQLRALLEVKTRGVGVRPDRQRWAYQIQWQMMATGLTRALLAEATIDDDKDEFVGLHVEWHDEDAAIQADLAALGADLYEHLMAGTLPEPDTPSALPIVKALHTGDAHTDTVELGADAFGDADGYLSLKAAVKDATRELDILEARLREQVGDATVGQGDGFAVKVSLPAKKLTDQGAANALDDWPEYVREVLDTVRFKAEHPDDYDSYRTRVGARRLTVTVEDD